MHIVKWDWAKELLVADALEYIRQSGHSDERTRTYLAVVNAELRKFNDPDAFTAWLCHLDGLGIRLSGVQRDQAWQAEIGELRNLGAALEALLRPSSIASTSGADTRPRYC